MRPSLHDGRHRASTSLHLPLFSFLALSAAFSLSLLATVRITSTLTSWRIESSARAFEKATIRGGIGKEGGDVDLDLGALLGERRARAHLSLYDDDEEEEAGDEPRQPPAGACAPMEHTDYFGTPIVEGPDFVVPTARECCEACANHRPSRKKEGGDDNSHLPCSVWVYCGDESLCGDSFGQCWLKHLAWPEASNPRTGPEVPWTSGLRSGRLSPALEEEREEEEEERRNDDDVADDRGDESGGANRRRSYHVAITASGPAVHWQSRVHYYWYLKQKRECERRERDEARSRSRSTSSAEKGRSRSFRCEMGGFTRVLHDAAGTPDDLSREIPTFVASPLPSGSDGGYVVLNRPWAFVQWLAAASIEEDYILMAEPDHLWLRPFQNPCPPDGSPAAFPFFYIEPSKEEYLPLVARALGKKTGKISIEEAERIAPIGNSPTWIRTSDLRDVAPLWMETSRRMFSDSLGARKAWGWVLEMYGFAVSLHGRAEEEERWVEERAKLSAAVAAREGREGGGAPSSLFPPLSPGASEAASRGKREQRRKESEENDVERRRRGGGGATDEGATAARATAARVRVLPRAMLQPPWDSKLSRGAALLHYTYGCDYSANGTFLPGEKGEWRFDKREWGGRRIDQNDENSKIVPSPPSTGELRALLESAPPRLRETAPATLKIVEMILEAAEAIPGWDRYAERGFAEQWWDGETFL